jgi:hypothetical protein
MHRSHWDIEVYAKDFQKRRWQEAARRRLAEEATGGDANGIADNTFNLTIARMLRSFRSWFSTENLSEAPRRTVGDTAAVAMEPEPTTPPRRLAQPYADMVVVARGPLAGVTEKPCVVRDC